MQTPWIEFFANKTKSIEESGFDVFKEKIWNESTCIYVYEIPLSTFKDLKNKHDYITQDNPNVLFRIYIDPLNDLFFEINGFDIIGNQDTNN
ncbi:MAG: hypothetical protein K2I76_03760 [Malacoplasma sp.]|nr:hypothetical protein [Malacoplasma sp.]